MTQALNRTNLGSSGPGMIFNPFVGTHPTPFGLSGGWNSYQEGTSATTT